MSTFCNPSCLVEQSQFSTIDICNLAEAMRSGEITQLVFWDCSINVNDITSAAEIAAYKAANRIVPTFPGRAKIDEKTTDGAVRIKCQDVATAGNYPFEFESELVDIETGSEWQVYNDLIKNQLNLLVSFVTCDEWMLINPRYSSGGKVGLKLGSLNISPIYEGVKDGKMKYVIKGTISEREIIRPIKLTAAVLALF